MFIFVIRTRLKWKCNWLLRWTWTGVWLVMQILIVTTNQHSPSKACEFVNAACQCGFVCGASSSLCRLAHFCVFGFSKSYNFYYHLERLKIVKLNNWSNNSHYSARRADNAAVNSAAYLASSCLRRIATHLHETHSRLMRPGIWIRLKCSNCIIIWN